jgi:hypothetical protein
MLEEHISLGAHTRLLLQPGLLDIQLHLLLGRQGGREDLTRLSRR